MSGWIEHYNDGDVTMGEVVEEGRERFFVVMDSGHYRVRIFPSREAGTLTIGIDTEWSDEHPGEMANYTPRYESGRDDCQPGEIAISEGGLLSVMARQRSASHVVIRMGWTAQLPTQAVEPMRRAIALAEQACTVQE